MKPFHDYKMKEWEVGAAVRNPIKIIQKSLTQLKPAGKKRILFKLSENLLLSIR